MLTLVILIVLVMLFYRVFIYKTPRRISTEAEDFTNQARVQSSKLAYVPDVIFGKWLSGIVTSVMDGDGFRFHYIRSSRSSHYSYTNLIIRLAGIDAPELGSPNMPAQPFAEEARDHLIYLVLDKEVSLKPIKRDMYGRYLAICRVGNNIIVNLEMVRAGFACVYTGYDAEYGGIFQRLKIAEAKARHQRLGMWIQDDYISPMDHKREYRRDY